MPSIASATWTAQSVRRLAVFAGAVERVDDPHPLLGEAGGVVLLLLGEQPVVGAQFAQRVDQDTALASASPAVPSSLP